VIDDNKDQAEANRSSKETGPITALFFDTVAKLARNWVGAGC
jgi:hypothetical protein